MDTFLERGEMDSPKSIKEIEFMVKNLMKKTPGPDRFTSEF